MENCKDEVIVHLESVIDHLDGFYSEKATPKDYKAIGSAVSYLKFFKKQYEKEFKNDLQLV